MALDIAVCGPCGQRIARATKGLALGGIWVDAATATANCPMAEDRDHKPSADSVITTVAAGVLSLATSDPWLEAMPPGELRVPTRMVLNPRPEDATPVKDVTDGLHCRWCGFAIRKITGGGEPRYQRTSLRTDERQSAFTVCGLNPLDGQGHAPEPQIWASLPVTSVGFPTGAHGVTLHIPGDKLFTLTPQEASVLAWEMTCVLPVEQLRAVVRALVDLLISDADGAHEVFDELGLLDKQAGYTVQVRRAEDGAGVQLWYGDLHHPVMLDDMDPLRVANLISALAGQLAHMDPDTVIP